MKTIHVTLNQTVGGAYRVERMTNAVAFSGPLMEAVTVGDYLTKKQAEALCAAKGVTVIVNAVKR